MYSRTRQAVTYVPLVFPSTACVQEAIPPPLGKLGVSLPTFYDKRRVGTIVLVLLLLEDRKEKGSDIRCAPFTEFLPEIELLLRFRGYHQSSIR